MKTRTLLSVYSVSGVIGGLMWFLLPAQSLAMYGIVLDPPLAALVRYAGSMQIGLALIAWAVRTAEAPVRKAVVATLCVTSAANTVACALGILTHRYNALAWGPTIFFAVFAILFALAFRQTLDDAATEGATVSAI